MPPAAFAAVLGWAVVSAEESPQPSPPPYEPTMVFKLAVTPAAPPPGKLRYELLPPWRDRTPGNAAAEYRRAVALLPKPPALDPDAWRARDESLQWWRECRLADFPTNEARIELQPYEEALAAADRAARMTYCEWDRPRPRTPATLLDKDLQSLREVVGWLRLRAKLELAEGRLDAALRTLQTAFQTAKHVGEESTLIDSLVGLAAVGVACGPAGEWATAPGSPNLYWAYATLPSPLLDPRPTVGGEAEFTADFLPGFRDLAAGPLPEAKAWAAVEKMRAALDMALREADAAATRAEGSGAGAGLDDALGLVFEFVFRGKPTKVEAALSRAVNDFLILARAPAARRWLLARGVRDVDKMPDVQAAYLAAWLRYRDRCDDTAVAYLLPTPEGVAHLRRAAEANRRAADAARSDPLARALLFGVPALETVFAAHVRTRRQVAALQAVEAVRAHLAAAGRFPKSWDEVTVVPVPDDPVTGKPFRYELKDGTALIICPPPGKEGPNRSNNLRYELTYRR